MTLFDLALLAIALGAAVAGWRAGLVHTVLSLAGFAAGLAAAAVLGPRLALAQSPADVARRNALLYGAFVLLPLVGAFLGGTLARALRGSKPPRSSRGRSRAP